MVIEKSEEAISELEQDYIILPKTHSSMYLMHKYWARKPANIVASYIKRYCPPNGIVLDPFLGSGVTVLESIFAGRKAIGIDLSPISRFICTNTGIVVNLDRMSDCFEYLRAQILESRSTYQNLFGFVCPECDQTAIITHIIWKNNYDPNLKPKENSQNKIDEIDEIRYHCSQCNHIAANNSRNHTLFKKLVSVVEDQDEIAQKLIESKQIIPPSFNFQYSDDSPFLQLRHNLRSNNDLQMLFSSRNLVFFTYLRNLIQNLPSHLKNLSEMFMFILTGAIAQASKMVWVIDKRKGKKLKKKQVGSWTHHFYWDPSAYFEVNGWNCFKERFKKVLKGKTESNARNIKSSLKFRLAASYDDLSDNNPVLLLTQSSISVSVPDNSVDFIFTDPPYGDSIQYGELSALWSTWLEVNMNEYVSRMEAEEIVINSKQGKKLNFYQDQLTLVFKEMHRVLKPEGIMLITFHNTSLKIRNALISSVVASAFTLKQILFQLPPRVSIKSMLHHKGTPIGDYYIRFQNNSDKLSDHDQIQINNQKHSLSNEDLNHKIETIIRDILERRGEPTSFIWISNLLDEYLFNEGLFPSTDLDLILKSLQNNSIFSINDQNKWWFRDESSVAQCETSLTEKIFQFLLKLKKTYEIKDTKSTLKQEIFNRVYKEFRGVYTPDKFQINQLIEEIFQNSFTSLSFSANKLKNP